MERPSALTLFKELSEWNRIEALIRESFSDSALQGRDFLKMKLSEYERLTYRYAGRADLPTDERALVVVLRFQQRNIRQSLYPGLIGRLWSRITGYITASRNANKQVIQAHNSDAYRYARQKLPLMERKDGEHQAEHYQQRHKYGNDLGGKKEHQRERQRKLIN